MNEGEKAANTWYDLRQRCKANYEGFSSVHLAVASLLVPRVDSRERRIFQCAWFFFSLKNHTLWLDWVSNLCSSNQHTISWPQDYKVSL